MESPEAPRAQTLPGRNPRRRRRPDADETGSLRSQPVRKRSKVEDDLFAPPVDLTGDDIPKPNGVNGHAAGRNGSAHQLAIPTRARPHHSTTSDSNPLLTSNDNYYVRQSAALPPQLRASPPYNGFVSPSTSLALAFTQTQAIVWDPNTSAGTLSTRTFSLPPAFHSDKLLPIGALVPAGGSSDTGLVAIAPSSGKITFWESIENAEALNLFEQRRNGLEGSVGGLFSGETITDIESAGHAGFIILFSSGRAAQLTLRDAQSKPSVNVFFLRNTAKSAAGFFGGIKNAFGMGGYLKSVVSAKSRSSTSRLHTDTLVASAEGVFQAWKLSWSGQAALQYETDVHALISQNIASSLKNLTFNEGALRIVDVALLSDATDQQTLVPSPASNAEPFDVVVLAYTGNEYLEYVAVKLSIDATDSQILWTRPLDTWLASMVMNPTWRPRLLVPRLSRTAAVIFDRGVVILSIADVPRHSSKKVPEKPPKPFQDAISFRVEPNYFVVGAGEVASDARNHAFTLSIFLRSHGQLSFTILEPESADGAFSRVPITAKIDIEQAIYCGTRPQNPLDLSNRSKAGYSLDQVEKASLNISQEILGSRTPYLMNLPGSMDHQLETRETALHHLATHLKHAYPPLQSKKARWYLRSNGERLAAARAIWQNYDSKLAAHPTQERLLPGMLALLVARSRLGTLTTADKDADPVRLFFTRSTADIGILMSWALHCVIEIGKRHGLDQQQSGGDFKLLTVLMNDAIELVICGYDAAWSYRAENAWLYNLQDEGQVEANDLGNALRGAPEPWTSTTVAVDNLKELVDQSRLLALEEINSRNGRLYPELTALASQNPKLIDLAAHANEERAQWLLGQPTQEDQLAGRKLQESAGEGFVEMVNGLSSINLTDAGFPLAENYRNMPALVNLVANKVADLKEDLSVAPDVREHAAIQAQVEEVDSRLKSYFDQYGKPFATAFFSAQVSAGRPSRLFGLAQSYPQELATFLRDNPSRRKLSWINDILSEGDFRLASQELMTIAAGQEDHQWSRRLQLSLSKIALLAAEETRQEPRRAEDQQNKEWQLAYHLSKIQGEIEDRILPVLFSAVDKSAAYQIANGEFGSRETKNRPHLQDLLRENLVRLVDGMTLDADRLIDILTLIDERAESDDIPRQDFVLALEALRHSGLDERRERFQTTRKVIWRRAILRDNWAQINKTKGKSDEALDAALERTVLFQTLYHASRTGLWYGSPEVSMPPPGELAAAGTQPEQLSERFTDRSICERLVKDMSKEKEALTKYIDGSRLEYWVETVIGLVEQRLRREEEETAARQSEVRNAAFSEERRSKATRQEHA